MPSRRNSNVLAMLLIGAIAVCAQAQNETDYYWRPDAPAQNHDWSVRTNWEDDQGGARTDPHTSDLMHVDNTAQGGKVCTYNADPPETVKHVWIEAENEIQHGAGHTLTISGALHVGWEETNGTYKLSGGTLAVQGHTYVGGSYGDGTFLHTSGTHTVLGKLSVGNASGGGLYEISGGSVIVGGETESGGNLVVGADGEGHFVQEGSGGVAVTQNQDDEGGSLIVGFHEEADYTLNGENADLVVQSAIVVGAYGEEGRFEWFAGTIDTPELTLVDPEEEEPERSSATLAMGLDFDVGDLISGDLFENSVYPNAELTGLDLATLEITNGGTATHESDAPCVEVKTLNIGDSEDATDGHGAYSFVGDTFSETEPALEAGAVLLAPTGTAEEGGGTLSVGDGVDDAKPLVVVKDYVTMYINHVTVLVSLYIGPESTITVEEGSECTISLTQVPGSFMFEVIDDELGNENMAGLAGVGLAFQGPGGDDDEYMRLEVAGEMKANYGVPEDTEFTSANFLIGRLIVGDDEAQGTMWVGTWDLVDNRSDGDNDEAAYVTTLDLRGGATFVQSCVDAHPIYYLRIPTESEQTENPRRFYMGDANLDGHVDGGDYTIWADNYGRQNARWNHADFNADRVVNGGDYTIWADNYPSPPPADRGGESAGYDKVIQLIAKCKDRDFDGDGDIDRDDVKILLDLEGG